MTQSNAKYYRRPARRTAMAGGNAETQGNAKLFYRRDTETQSNVKF